MQKTIIGGLVILVIALLAFNARLQERERVLEERLAVAERKRAPKVAPAPEPAPAPEVVSTPMAPPPAAAAPTPPPAIAQVASSKPSPATERFLQGNLKALADGTLVVEPQGFQLTMQEGMIEGKAVYSAVLSQGVQQVEQPALADGRKPGYLGISGGDAKGGGAEVTSVFDNGVAGIAGLKNGDVIVEFNGESVQGLADLARRIQQSGEGAPVSLRIRRDGNEFVQGVQLGRRP